MRRNATLSIGILAVVAATSCGDDEPAVARDAAADQAADSPDLAGDTSDTSDTASDPDGDVAQTDDGTGEPDLPATVEIRLNELVASPLEGAEDWIELHNPSEQPFDLGGWSVTDDDPEHVFAFPAGSTVPADGYLVIERDAPDSFDFGLGDEDGLFLYDTNDALIDAVSWLAGDAPTGRSYGRIPDGTGTFQTLNTPTPGEENVDNGEPECGNDVIDTDEACDGDTFGPYSCTTYGLGTGGLDCGDDCDAILTDGCSGAGTPIAINEVRSTVDDAIELYNHSEEAVDLSGWVIGDDDPEHRYTLPDETILTAGAYLVLIEGVDHTFGIGSDDAVQLFDDEAALRDAVDWLDNEALVSYCRRPNGTGAFDVCDEATFGATNGD